CSRTRRSRFAPRSPWCLRPSWIRDNSFSGGRTIPASRPSWAAATRERSPTAASKDRSPQSMAPASSRSCGPSFRKADRSRRASRTNSPRRVPRHSCMSSIAPPSPSRGAGRTSGMRCWNPFGRSSSRAPPSPSRFAHLPPERRSPRKVYLYLEVWKLEIGCGARIREFDGRRYFYFWHYERDRGRSTRKEDYIGRVDSEKAKADLVRRMAAYHRTAEREFRADAGSDPTADRGESYLHLE